MIKKIIILFFIFTSISYAQLAKLEMRGFRGLDTKSNQMMADPMSAKVAHNIDFGANPGSLTLRKGYDTVATMEGQDSIWVFPVRYSDGTSQLLIVADSSNVGYGGLYLTDLGVTDIGNSGTMTKIWSYWGVTQVPKVATYGDNIYISNGVNKTVMYDGDKKVAREMPLNKPGEPWIVPLTTSGSLDGEYVYRMSIYSVDGNYDSELMPKIDTFGVLTSPVIANEQSILLTKFPWIAEDSIFSMKNWFIDLEVVTVSNNTDYVVTINGFATTYTSDASATEAEITAGIISEINSNASINTFTNAWQTHTYQVYIKSNNFSSCTISNNLETDGGASYRYKFQPGRSLPNPGKITIEDTAIFFTAQSAPLYVADTASVDTLTWIDDGTLAYNKTDHKLIDRARVGKSYNRYGAPGFSSQGSTGGNGYGVYSGYDVDTSISTLIGYAYKCLFRDSLTGLVSDTGRSMFLYTDNYIDDSLLYYEISLPCAPYGEDNYYVELYRAPLTTVMFKDSVSYDSVVNEFALDCYTYYDKLEKAYMEECVPRDDDELYSERTYGTESFTRTWYVPKGDTIVGNWRRVGRYKGETVVPDSIRYDSMYNSDSYPKMPSASGAVPLFSSMFTMNSRLFGVYGSRLYYSDLNIELLNLSNLNWEQLNYIPISEDDGDFIVSAFPDKDVIRVYKNRSSYIVREVDDEFLTMSLSDGTAHITLESSANIGMIAPGSFQRGIEGNYFLSEHGVLLTRSSQTLENDFTNKLLSGALDNFTKKDISSTSKAQSYYINKERKYLLCIGDTTYVYDAKMDAWSTWDLTFSSAFSYSAGTSDNVGDTMYFVPSGTALLCRYGTSSTDNGTVIDMEWQSQDLLVTPDYKSIHKIGTWLEDGSNSDSLYFYIYNPDDSLLDSIIVDSLNNMYNGNTFSSNEAQFYYFKLANKANDTLDNIKINGIDVVYESKTHEYKYK